MPAIGNLRLAGIDSDQGALVLACELLAGHPDAGNGRTRATFDDDSLARTELILPALESVFLLQGPSLIPGSIAKHQDVGPLRLGNMRDNTEALSIDP